jgi:DNA polymerase III alpha subunit
MTSYSIDEFGRAVVSSNGLFELWLQGIDEQGLAISTDAEIEEYNRQCTLHSKQEYLITTDLSVPPTHFERSGQWMIPAEFQTIDVEAWCLELCTTDEERDRVKHEMRLFDFYGMIPVVRSLIYMVGVFRERKIVWGIGRGSSVASFVLYLIGVHKINPIRFGLKVEDFLR